MATAISLQDLLPASEDDFELCPYKFLTIPNETSCADLPEGFAVRKICVGDRSCTVLTEPGRFALRKLIVELFFHVEKGKAFTKLEVNDVVLSCGEFHLDVDSFPLNNLSEDEYELNIDKMLSAAENFVTNICGGYSNIPPDTLHLLSLTRSEIEAGELISEFIAEHTSMRDLSHYAAMMWDLGFFLGLSDMHNGDDLEVENMLATLDPACYPSPWIDHVKMVAGSDTQYNYMVKVLNECQWQTCKFLGKQKGLEVFSGVKGIAIFFRGLIGHAFKDFPFKEALHGFGRLLPIMKFLKIEEYHKAFYGVFKAVYIMFPVFLPSIWTASLRSPTLMDRVEAEYIKVFGVAD